MYRTPMVVSLTNIVEFDRNWGYGPSNNCRWNHSWSILLISISCQPLLWFAGSWNHNESQFRIVHKLTWCSIQLLPVVPVLVIECLYHICICIHIPPCPHPYTAEFILSEQMRSHIWWTAHTDAHTQDIWIYIYIILTIIVTLRILYIYIYRYVTYSKTILN